MVFFTKKIPAIKLKFFSPRPHPAGAQPLRRSPPGHRPAPPVRLSAPLPRAHGAPRVPPISDHDHPSQQSRVAVAADDGHADGCARLHRTHALSD